MRAHRARQEGERRGAGTGWTDLGLVFANRHGRPLDSAALYRDTCYPLRERTGLPRLHLHELARHSLATFLLEAGVDRRIAPDVLRHADASITLAVYQHVRGAVQREALAKVERLVPPKRDAPGESGGKDGRNDAADDSAAG